MIYEEQIVFIFFTFVNKIFHPDHRGLKLWSRLAADFKILHWALFRKKFKAHLLSYCTD